jgi:hypothetical protein
MPITMKGDYPEEIGQIGAERDALMNDAMDSIMPPLDKPINAKVLNALAKAINAVSKVMGIEVEIEQYDEATTLDDDVARFLMMMSTAAEDYGKPFPVALDAIRGDSEITAITAHLMDLARDPKFKAFLEEPMEGETEVEIKVSRDMDDDEEMEDEDEDFDFASRM